MHVYGFCAFIFQFIAPTRHYREVETSSKSPKNIISQMKNWELVFRGSIKILLVFSWANSALMK